MREANRRRRGGGDTRWVRFGRHAVIVRQRDAVWILDDHSLTGVFVNDNRVEWNRLTDGDHVLVGRYRLHFIEIPSAAEAS